MGDRFKHRGFIRYGCVLLIWDSPTISERLRRWVANSRSRFKSYGGAVTVKLRPYWLIDIAQAILIFCILAYGIIYLMNIPTSASSLVDGPMTPVPNRGGEVQFK